MSDQLVLASNCQPIIVFKLDPSLLGSTPVIFFITINAFEIRVRVCSLQSPLVVVPLLLPTGRGQCYLLNETNKRQKLHSELINIQLNSAWTSVFFVGNEIFSFQRQIHIVFLLIITSRSFVFGHFVNFITVNASEAEPSAVACIRWRAFVHISLSASHLHPIVKRGFSHINYAWRSKALPASKW